MEYLGGRRVQLAAHLLWSQMNKSKNCYFSNNYNYLDGVAYGLEVMREHGDQEVGGSNLVWSQFLGFVSSKIKRMFYQFSNFTNLSSQIKRLFTNLPKKQVDLEWNELSITIAE